MAGRRKLSVDQSRTDLFERLVAAKDSIVRTTAKDTDIEVVHIEPAFDRVLDLVAEPVPTPEQIAAWREEGVRLARDGAAAERVLDGYLSLNWAIWEAAMREEDIAREVILDFADRLLRGLDDALAAISEGYIRVEVELAAAHSDERRAVLEELLTAPRATPEDRARIRRRSERHGLSPQGSYRLILVYVPGMSDAGIENAIDDLEKRIRVPGANHRDKPGIRLPVVLDWRGHVLVFAKGEWAGERRLREALPYVVGEDVVVIDTGPVEGCEALADALAQADYSATVATNLGRRGWIGIPASWRSSRPSCSTMPSSEPPCSRSWGRCWPTSAWETSCSRPWRFTSARARTRARPRAACTLPRARWPTAWSASRRCWAVSSTATRPFG